MYTEFWRSSMFPSGRAALALPPGKAQGKQRNQQRHQADVDEFQARAERLDLVVQPTPNLAQFLANLHLLVEKALQLGALLRRQDHLLVLALAGLQFAQLLLGFAQ